MPTNAVLLEIDGGRVVETLQEAAGKLDSAEADVTLDFSSVRRIDPAAVAVLEKLAAKAGEKSLKLILRGVDVEVYKVLKLTKLAPRFSFES